MHTKQKPSLKTLLVTALWLAPAALIASMAAPGCEAVIKTDLVDCPNDPTNPGCAQWGFSTSVSSSSVSTGSGAMCGGGARSCEKQSDCGVSTECLVYDCVSGCCNTQLTNVDTPLTKGQIAGDCQQTVCDGKGATTIVADATDVPPAKDGCNTGACSGMTVQQQPIAGTCMLSGAPAVCGAPAGAAGGKCVECNTSSDCPAGDGCTTNTCLSASCKDGMLDGNETDVDCGGSCLPCSVGSSCKVTADCAPGYCNGGICATASCTDKVADGDETDVDCGGSCPTKCAEGKGCSVPGDCQTAVGGQPTCTGQVCGFQCASGFEDCDATLGCETDITTPTNCGACGTKCSAYCVSGACNDPIAIAAGYDHNCAILKDGSVYCWGFNQLGEVGDGTTGNQPFPTKVNLPHPATAISADGAYLGGVIYTAHTCVILSDQSVWCWGGNANGELGQGNLATVLGPVQVKGLGSITQLVVGGGHTCAVTVNGDLYCWGYNTEGEVGVGTHTAVSTATLILSSVTSAVSQVALGDFHTCVIKKTDNKLYCWGYNGDGELGSGNTTETIVPGPAVAGLTNVLQVVGGGPYTCARMAASTYCWGINSNAQLGLGNVVSPQMTPQLVSGLNGLTITSLVGGLDHAGAITTSGNYMWGVDGDGDLGDGKNGQQPTPELVPQLSTMISMSSSERGSCGLTAGHQMYAWGYNAYGQFGNGTMNPGSNVPLPVLWP